jgi:putative hydrolase of HD superfamily
MQQDDAQALSARRCISLLLRCGGLKREKRTGWVLSGVPWARVESVADHSHRVALAALLLSSGAGGAPADCAHAALVGLVHDLAEAETGDIVSRGQTAAQKAAKSLEEGRVMRSLTEALGPRAQAGLLEGLWAEYEAASTPAAALVKDMDKLELMLQALEYERDHPGLTLDSFYTALAGIKGAEAQAWGREVLRLRAELMRSREEQAASWRAWALHAACAACALALGVGLALRWGRR